MGLSFTKAQQHAIDFEGKDTLISAAAGSGKTAVLSERVIRKLKNGVSLDDLVLLTFTNKAAAEMKARIRRKIAGISELAEELQKIDAAHIKTFDAYAFYLLKRYGYVKNIPKTISILDQTDAVLLKESIMEKLFEEYLTAEHQGFLALMKRYTDKSDTTLKKNLLSFYDKLSYFKNKDAFEETLRTTYFTSEHFETLFTEYEQDVLSSVQRFLGAIKKLKNNRLEHELSLAFIDESWGTFSPLEQVNTYEEVQTFFAMNPRFPKIKAGKQDDELWQHEKDHLKTYKEKVLNKLLDKLKGSSSQNGDAEIPKDEHKQAYLSLQNHTECIMALLNTFETRYLDEQHRIERFDYTGVARSVLSILEENPNIREELSSNLNEIMVDEYQDTNALQEAFLQLIKRNNLYMVGDIKQSIYRFRNAEPSIFANKYVHFKKSGEGEAIDLNLNFRSRSEVLSDINTVFAHVMNAAIGGIDYDDNQALKYGNKSYSDYYSENTPYGITFHSYDQTRFEAIYDATFTKKEAELMHVAKTIKTMVGEGTIQTKENDGLRPVQYGDFAILIDRGTSFDEARRIFEYVGVPLLVHKNVDFTDYPEIMMVKQLLTLVVSLNDSSRYKTDFKRAFMSVTRSFISTVSDDEIVAQVLNLPDTLEKPSVFMESIHLPFKPLLEKAFECAAYVQHNRLDESVFNIVHTFEVYENIVRISSSEDGVARLDYLLELAHAKMNEGITLEAFIDYFKAMTDNDLSIELSLRSDFSAHKVNLMTMHKSKGLEFPHVFIVHLENTFRNPIDTNMLISERYGVLLPHDNEGDDKHFLYSLYRNEEKRDDISERLRLLYVALTRAEEGLHIVYCDDEKAPTYAPEGIVDGNVRRQYRSFHDVFKSVLPLFKTHKKTLDIARYQDDTMYKTTLQAGGIPEGDLIEKTYVEAPPKPEVATETSFSTSISEFLDDHSLSAIDKGNLFHDTLEHLDFFTSIPKQLDAFDLSDNDKSIIQAFFESSLIQSLDMVQTYKEYPFAYEGETGLVSGFIDLLIETKDAFIIIDYKLKAIDKPQYITQVQGYKDMLKTLTSKRVEGYLYSILEKRFKSV